MGLLKGEKDWCKIEYYQSHLDGLRRNLYGE